MIQRHWTAQAHPEAADDYERFLETHTFVELARLEGFLNGTILRAERGGAVVFRVITEWESLEAVRAFAGDDIERAVVPRDVQRMLARYDQKVVHYEVRLRVGRETERV